ncbi:sensor histidine kinase [Salipiger sp. IMCC34102]|uniref:sensor histidine kinase n=1 Tax=Salipiger sp. IMCC34102 TaxID=2510647 RepID=UPI00101D27EB|nr:ATP-binding protein [Salipiger sp. IMCC34102]RYH03174.1 sensor histidine kinase [Salipiger sp. IMCC34102]
MSKRPAHKARTVLSRWRLRLAVLALCLLGAATIYVTNILLTERFTESTRNRAEVRLTLYVANLMAELQRNAIVPQLLSRDPALIGALREGDFSLSTQRLLSYVDEIEAASLMLLDSDGRVVAATDRNRLGESFRGTPQFVNAVRSNSTIFTRGQTPQGGSSFVYSRRLTDSATTLGVILVAVDLARIERGWAGVSDAVYVTDSEGTIILSTEPRWRGQAEEDALALEPPSSAIDRALRATEIWNDFPIDAYFRGEAVMRRDQRVPFQGWRMVSFTSYSSVRERVNGVLALEVMGFAILLALLFWFSSRRSATRVAAFERESADLRKLNAALQREIAARKAMERNLQVAEQTVEQTSKLAALGEMSAAVSHELNQPLAAMKTYLAGARLLLQRKRPDETLASFQRIDDLIDRMGAITRQLKSYARKGSDAFEPVDARAAVSSALAMMEPQLKTREVEITRTLPSEPALIHGDRLRLEQVIINLLRNALDATKTATHPRIDVILALGDTVTLTVRDNGTGIEDLTELFEPFYTTKQPGDGVGLGLAISSGIVNDLGGRMTARNGAGGGAVFEVQLPLLKSDLRAAE